MVRDYSVNRKIKEFISKNDKKPTAVAEKAGIRKDTFSRILHCKRPLFAEEILPLCKALGIPVSYLFEDDVETEPLDCDPLTPAVSDSVAQ